MSSIQAVNYRDNLFVKPDLSPILGQPDYESLYQLNTDLRANAFSVHSNLGGGAHGHLLMVLLDILLNKWNVTGRKRYVSFMRLVA